MDPATADPIIFYRFCGTVSACTRDPNFRASFQEAVYIKNYNFIVCLPSTIIADSTAPKGLI